MKELDSSEALATPLLVDAASSLVAIDCHDGAGRSFRQEGGPGEGEKKAKQHLSWRLFPPFPLGEGGKASEGRDA